jgi:ATP-dependent Clp protease ATP-binding subunit ClpA
MSPATKQRWSRSSAEFMKLANSEARRLNHEYIGTEHILLALVEMGCSAAVLVLKDLNIDPREIRTELERVIQRGPDDFTFGKLPQTPRARIALQHAIEQASRFNHDQIYPEHVLLGLLCEEDNVAAQVLMNLGLELEHLRTAIIRWWEVRMVDPSWLAWNNGTVLRMASVIEQERRWAQLPILADALEDAGCTDWDMLGHLRLSGEHRCGCWVLDRLMAGI